MSSMGDFHLVDEKVYILNLKKKEDFMSSSCSVLSLSLCAFAKGTVVSFVFSEVST